MDNTIEGNKGGRSIYMGRLKNGSSNELLATEFLVVRDNVTYWVCLTPMIVSRRVGLFLSDPVSWIIDGGWRESDIEVIGLRTIASAIHSIGTEYWNCNL